ncbi:MAG: hypothetical protein KA791_13115 [Flavobacteriales bacterium]|nr:hypothetical protein [Flavobacteriales bacterium]
MPSLSRSSRFFPRTCGYFLFGVLVGAVSAQAQTPPDTVRLLAELITVDDGLPAGMTQAILQDRSGHLWFGTRDGLTRSDGYAFTVFRHDAADSGSLSDNIIVALFEDRDGYLWIGTESGRIDRYDPRAERFAHVDMRATPDTGMFTGTLGFGQDVHGNIWAFSHNGQLYALRSSTADGSWHSERPRKVFPQLTLPQRCSGLMSDQRGALWITFRDSLLCVTDPVRGSALRRSLLGLPPGPTINSYAPLVDAEQGLVHVVLGNAVNSFNARTAEPGRTHILSRTGQNIGQNLCALGAVWVSNNAGLFRLSTMTGRVEELEIELMNGQALPEHCGVSSWAADRAGNVWIGTNGFGVLKIGRVRQLFHRQPGLWTVLSAEVNGGYLYAHVHGEQLNHPSGKVVPGAAQQAVKRQGLFDHDGTYARDPQGRSWTCTAEHSDTKRRLTLVEPTGRLSFPALLRGNESPILVFPGRADDIWVAAALDTSGLNWGIPGCLYRIDTRSSKVIGRYELPRPLSISNRGIAHFMVRDDGTAWCCTAWGVYALDPSDATWRHYQPFAGDSTVVGAHGVISLCFDPDDPQHFAWMGSKGMGMAKVDLRTGAAEYFTMADGLPNEMICGILPDAHRNLWISTNQGLCRFDPRTKAITHFTSADGLLSNEFNTHGFAASSDGRLFFSGPAGTISFDPEDFYTPVAPSPTVLTGLRLMNVPVRIDHTDNSGTGAYTLPAAISTLTSIELPYSERMITIAFACMDHTAPEKNRYRYQLAGFSDTWIDAGAAHEATFTHLDPGTFTFRVQSANSAGVWDEQGASITLIIAPPWWGTWWFRGFAIVAFLGALYSFYRYRLAQALKVALVRDRIARDLHDEIGSTLSSVALFSEVAMRESGSAGGPRSAMLTRISQSTSQMMESMNDIVWAVNSKNDDLQLVAQRMQEFAGRIAEAGDFELVFTNELPAGQRPLTMLQRKNLYLIFKEAVNNAAKYSGRTKLVVHLRTDQSKIVLLVQDNGRGFEAPVNGNGHPRGGGNGLGNMRARAQEMGGELIVASTPGEGTAVELRFKP